MSHFVVGVILPKSTDPEYLEAVKTTVAAILAPFDENLEVPEYDAVCDCVGRAARSAAWHEADSLVGAIDDLRASFPATLPPPLAALSAIDRLRNDEIDALWKQHLKPHRDAERAAFDRDPDRETPDPTCGFYTADFLNAYPDPGKRPGDRYEDGSGCGGTGTYRTTSNPQSKWDGWVIGGRWTGFFGTGFRGGVPLSPNEQYDLDHESVGRDGNVARVRDVPVERLPHAILTPDGQWHEKGQMGWFGMIHDEKEPEVWDRERRAIFAEHLDHLVVAVDCHI